MTPMGDHARKGAVPRRAMFSAWTVFLSMAGTTMAYQVYHSIKHGQMPWELAVLYGVVPLAISIGVLDFVAEWEDAPRWAPPSAYLITGGSMFLSATATGSVVLHAAPGHLSGLFGLLLDAAALLSVRFILTAPRKARERAAQEAAERVTAERAEAGELAQARRRLAELSAQRTADVSDLQAELEEERSARESAQRESAQALTRVEALERKLAALSDQKPRKATAAAKGKGDAAQDSDVTTELRAIMELQADPELCKPRMGGELARRLGVSAATGRRLHSRLTHEGSLNQSLARSLSERPE